MGIEGKCGKCGFSPTLDYSCLRCTEKERDQALLQVEQYRKMLWWLARDGDSLILQIPKKELESIPEGAELLVWYEELFDSMMLKGICSSINQPDIATPVVQKPVEEAPILHSEKYCPCPDCTKKRKGAP